MKGVLSKFIGQDRRLLGPVVKLQSLGLFMGVFLGTYTLIAQTLFLNELGDELVSFALLASGIIGIFLSNIFTYFQSRTSFSKLCIVGFSSILLFTIITWFFLEYTHARGLIFLLFAMIYPLTTLFQLVFWGVFGRLFNLKESKKIIGSIDTGKLLGQILSFFLAPFLLNFTKIDHIQFICIISSLICLVILSTLLSNKSLGDVKQHFTKTTESTNMVKMLKNNYVFLIASFVVLSFVVSSFVEYSFMVVTHKKFDAKDIMGFLGIFNGCVLLTSLLLQTMVNERLINMYGVKVSLLILPVVLITTSLSVVSISLFSNYEVGTESFFWFFLLIALSKLVTQILREALEEPAYKLYYLPLDVKVRFNIQARIDGVVKELGRTLGGVVISILGVIAAIQFHHYFIILSIVISVWVVVIFNLHKQYQSEVKNKLNQSKKKHYYTRDEKSIIIKLLRRIKNIGIPVWSTFASEILEKWGGRKKEIDGTNTIDDLIILEDTIKNLVNSIRKVDRVKAADLMVNQYDDQFYNFLLRLLNDEDSEVVFASLAVIRKNKLTDFIAPLMDRLEEVKIKTEVQDTISSIVTYNNNTLENFFSKPKASQLQKLCILEILARKQGVKEIDFLWDAVNDPDLIIGNKAYTELSMCNIKANAEQAIMVKLNLNKKLTNIVWNEYAVLALGTDSVFDQLKESIQEENQKCIDEIFVLLSLLYESSSINLIKENIKTDVPENIAFAIELLDVILNDDIKRSVIAILDTTNELERMKRIETLYPYDKMDSEYVLRHIPLRDYSQVSAWTKACALHLIGELNKTNLKDVLMSELYHPDPLIYEVAAKSLFKLDAVAYNASLRLYFNKLEKKIKQSKIKYLERMDKDTSTRFHQIAFVKHNSLMKNIGYLELSKLFNSVRFKIVKTRDQLLSLSNTIAIISTGELVVGNRKMETGSLIDLQVIDDAKPLIIDELRLITINKDLLFNYMYDDIDFALGIFKEIERKAA